MSSTVEVKKPTAESKLAEKTAPRRTYRPTADILETDQELLVVAELPGVELADIDIQFENGLLTLQGKVKEHAAERAGAIWTEFEPGDYARTFNVTEFVDADKIHAEYADGVLVLHLPKAEAAKARKIKVQAK